ncbi:terminase small subunit [Xanthobacter oligotrophicus]|nr:terminase small subunit [Xanthobacter oligotrophicus]
MDERAARTGVTAERVLEEIARIAFFDLRKAFNADGSLRLIGDMDGSLGVAELMDADGLPTGRLKKILFADKLGALALLARHLGMLNDKVTLKRDDENPLTLLIKEIQGTSIKPVATPATLKTYAEH